MSPLPTGPLSPQEEADWRDIARADGTSMTTRFFATLDAEKTAHCETFAVYASTLQRLTDCQTELAAARDETKAALSRLSEAENRIRELEPEPGAWIGDW